MMQNIFKRPLKVRLISPLCGMSPDMLDGNLGEVGPLRELGIECDNVTIGGGPDSVENHFDEAFSTPYVVIEAIRAEREGVDAVIIDCMGDPGLMAAREAVSIPVIGPGEACMHLAGLMGNRFTCVSILDSVRPIFFAHAKVYGVADKLASVRVINLPVLEIEEHMKDGRLVMALYDQSVIAIEEDYADTVILGCTGFLGVAERVEAALRNGLAAAMNGIENLHQSVQERLGEQAKGYHVPVINPLPAAGLLAATLVWGRMAHSPHAYHKANFNKISKFPTLEMAQNPKMRVEDYKGTFGIDPLTEIPTHTDD